MICSKDWPNFITVPHTFKLPITDAINTEPRNFASSIVRLLPTNLLNGRTVVDTLQTEYCVFDHGIYSFKQFWMLFLDI